MKKILGLILYAAVMFGVTAGLGTFMLKQTAPDKSDHAAGSDKHGAPGLSNPGHISGGTATSDVRTVQAFSSQPGGLTVSSGLHKQTDKQLPVAVRSSPMSIEEIVRMGMSLNVRDDALRQREQAMKDADSHHRLIQADVEGAQQQVENLLAQASDQRAAIEELVARINAQKDVVNNERLALTNEKQQLKADRDTLDADRRQMEAQKTALAQSEADLTLKRKQLDTDRLLLDSDRTKFAVDGEKLIKDREKWVSEVERMNGEKQKLAIEREQIDVERKTLDQDKRLLASMPGASALPSQKKAPSAADSTKNLKQLTEMFEGMSPLVAANTIKELVTTGEIDMVVDVLAQLEQRKASAILDSIADEKLVSEFLVKINSRNSQTKAARN